MLSLRYRTKRAIVFFRRLSYLGGNRVQSPFVYNFVCEVINNHTPYYAYRDLKPQLRALGLRERKVAKLLFRLANRIQPEQIILPPGQSQYKPFLRAGCQKAQFCPSADENHTTLYIIENPEPIQPLRDGSLTIIFNIRRNRATRQAWQQLTAESWATLTFDLYHLGLILQRPNIHKQHYIINY